MALTKKYILKNGEKETPECSGLKENPSGCFKCSMVPFCILPVKYGIFNKKDKDSINSPSSSK